MWSEQLGGQNEASGTNIAFQHPEGLQQKRRDDDSGGDFAARRDDPAVTHSLCHLGFHGGRSEFAGVHGDGGGWQSWWVSCDMLSLFSS